MCIAEREQINLDKRPCEGERTKRGRRREVEATPLFLCNGTSAGLQSGEPERRTASESSSLIWIKRKRGGSNSRLANSRVNVPLDRTAARQVCGEIVLHCRRERSVAG